MEQRDAGSAGGALDVICAGARRRRKSEHEEERMRALANRPAQRAAAASVVRAAAVLAAALATVSPAGGAAAAERPGLQESREFIEKLADEAIRVWGGDHPTEEERLAAMESLIRSNFDVDFIVRGVLGRAWRKLSAAQREAFGDLFYEFFREVYLPNLSRFERDDLRVLGARPRGKRDVAVESEVRSGDGQWVDTGWRVRTAPEGLRVIDVVVAGVSLLLVQREEFNATIRGRGFEGLMRDLRARVAAAAAGGAAGG